MSEVVLFRCEECGSFRNTVGPCMACLVHARDTPDAKLSSALARAEQAERERDEAERLCLTAVELADWWAASRAIFENPSAAPKAPTLPGDWGEQIAAMRARQGGGK